MTRYQVFGIIMTINLYHCKYLYEKTACLVTRVYNFITCI